MLCLMLAVVATLSFGVYFIFKKSEEGSYIGNRWVKGKTKYYRVGGGDMYPTFAWCYHYDGLEDYAKSANEESFRLAPELILKDENFKPQRGMIVAFKNRQGIDRIIALPGDRVVLNNGYVYVNGSLLQEPYVINKASTYGELRIPNCKEVVVQKIKFLFWAIIEFFL
ncbi:MAG: S26 family signal peptidase [Patescibacteria group bacterium]|nr:S26 family signal peptidase [Patescibacteria group bacterium]